MSEKPPIDLEEIEFFFPNMHVTRSSIKKGDVVPLHVRGNKYGLVYILSGRSRITNYSIVKRDGLSYVLELIADKEYTDHDYTIVSKKNNVHRIEALEDTTFFDVFTVGFSDETFQVFLKIKEKNEDASQIVAKEISIEEAGIPQHLLDKVCKEIKIDT